MIYEDAIDLVQYFEGCSNEAYACPSHVSHGGKWNYLTIGYGHSGPDVFPGMRISTSQARELLARDLANAESMVRGLVSRQLSPEKLGAVTALAFNLKPGLFRRSKTLALLNAGQFGSFDLASAYQQNLGSLTDMARNWAEFRNVETADGRMQPLLGLVRRRACELQLFFVGRWDVPTDSRMPQLLVDPGAQEEQRSLRPGMRSGDIADLHNCLASVGFPVVCTDAYTWATSEAVKAFQMQHGLTPDGVYGMQTAAKLAEIVGHQQ